MEQLKKKAFWSPKKNFSGGNRTQNTEENTTKNFFADPKIFFFGLRNAFFFSCSTVVRNVFFHFFEPIPRVLTIFNEFSPQNSFWCVLVTSENDGLPQNCVFLTMDAGHGARRYCNIGAMLDFGDRKRKPTSHAQK